MNTKKVKFTQLKVNEENPRSITSAKFEKLVDSLLCFPKMLSIRPIVTDSKMIALGGNMRLRALQQIHEMGIDNLKKRLGQIRDFSKKTKGEKQVIEKHWEEWLASPIVEVIPANELTEDEKKQFIIKDNVSYGTWDYDALANKWDSSDIESWGLDVWTMPTTFEERTANDTVSEDVDFFQSELPEELQGVDLSPAAFPKIKGDDQTSFDRVIIVYSKEQLPNLCALLGLSNLTKVVYKLDELIPEMTETYDV